MSVALPLAPKFDGPFPGDSLFASFLTWCDSIDDLTSALKQDDVPSGINWDVVKRAREEVISNCGENGTVSARKAREFFDRCAGGMNERALCELVRKFRKAFDKLPRAIPRPVPFTIGYLEDIKFTHNAFFKTIYEPLKRRGLVPAEVEAQVRQYKNLYHSRTPSGGAYYDIDLLVQLPVTLRFLIRYLSPILHTHGIEVPESESEIAESGFFTRMREQFGYDEHSVDKSNTTRATLLAPTISQRKMQLYQI